MKTIQNLKHSFDQANMILYAGSTWDWHKIHYDKNYLEENKIPSPVVDGQVFGALISKQLLEHFGNFSRVLSMDFQYKSMVFSGKSIEISSVIVNEASDKIEIQSKILCGDRVVIDNAISFIGFLNE